MCACPADTAERQTPLFTLETWNHGTSFKSLARERGVSSFADLARRGILHGLILATIAARITICCSDYYLLL